MNRRTYCARFALAGLLSLAPALATVIFSTGFEPPTYTTGQLAGQNGWSMSTVPVVENTTVFAGSQAVAANSSGGGSQVVEQPLSYNATGQTVVASVEFMEGSGSQPEEWVPLYAAGSSGTIAFLTIQSGNATPDSGFLPGSVPVNVGQWYDYELVLNFATQTFSGYVDSTLIGSGSFDTSETTLQDVDLGFGGLPGMNTATGYWDNLSITAVPEPSAFFLCLGALPGLALLSRKRRAA